MKGYVATALFCICWSAAASEAVQDVPAQFVGEWNSNVADCGTGNNDSALELRKDRITYYESEGPLRAIVVDGPYELALIAELSGEGETWMATAQFRLSPDESRLTSINIPGHEFIRYRCPVRQ